MRIGVQTGGMEKHMNLDGAYRLIAESGFDAADANVDQLIPYRDIVDKRIPDAFRGSDAACAELFRPWGDAARKYGVGNDQAHAPFPSMVWSPEDPAYNDLLLEMLRKTIIGCDVIGCRKLIIHPFFYPYEHAVSRAQEIEENLSRYEKLIAAARQYGVTICLENMFTSHNGKIMAACCSDMQQTCQLIDELNRRAGADVFGFCLDTGHLLLLGLDVLRAMQTLGKRIVAFHIHDNDGMRDRHLAPYMGVMDWKRFVDGLRVIRYQETLSFETYNIWNVVDPALCPDVMRLIARTGRLFAAQAGELEG